jgi:hypothetical protein
MNGAMHIRQMVNGDKLAGVVNSRGREGGIRMKAKLATLAIAMSLLALAPTQASAWVCRADGFGATAIGRGYSPEQAKFYALGRCERRSLLHVCTIRWCRP